MRLIESQLFFTYLLLSVLLLCPLSLAVRLSLVEPLRLGTANPLPALRLVELPAVVNRTALVGCCSGTGEFDFLLS